MGRKAISRPLRQSGQSRWIEVTSGFQATSDQRSVPSLQAWTDGSGSGVCAGQLESGTDRPQSPHCMNSQAQVAIDLTKPHRSCPRRRPDPLAAPERRLHHPRRLPVPLHPGRDQEFPARP